MRRVISHFHIMASRLAICSQCSCSNLRYLLQGRWVLIPTQTPWPNSPSPETSPEIISIHIHRYHNLVSNGYPRHLQTAFTTARGLKWFSDTPCIRCCFYWRRCPLTYSWDLLSVWKRAFELSRHDRAVYIGGWEHCNRWCQAQPDVNSNSSCCIQLTNSAEQFNRVLCLICFNIRYGRDIVHWYHVWMATIRENREALAMLIWFPEFEDPVPESITTSWSSWTALQLEVRIQPVKTDKDMWVKYTFFYLNMFAKLHSRVQEQPCTFAASMFWYALTWTSRQVTATRWQCTPHNCCGNSSHLTSNHVQGYLYTTTKMPRHAKKHQMEKDFCRFAVCASCAVHFLEVISGKVPTSHVALEVALETKPNLLLLTEEVASKSSSSCCCKTLQNTVKSKPTEKNGHKLRRKLKKPQ